MRWENNISEWTGLKFATPYENLKTKSNGGKGLLGPWLPNGHHDYGIGAGAGAGVLYNWYIYNKGTWSTFLTFWHGFISSLIFLRLSREFFLFYLIFNIIKGVFWYRPFTKQERQRWLSLTTIQSNPALRTPTLYRHLIITASLLCPWGKKVLTFSQKNSTRFIRTLLWPPRGRVRLI